ncbi:MAG: molecular chaperone TorD family protein [Blautia sp.]|nr:molecular chaperone TorD family protein [Blautia sp.]
MRRIEEQEIQELLLVNRNYLYQLFYKAFGREPDEAFWDILMGESTRRGLLLLEEGPSLVGPALEALGRIGQEEGFLERAREEYIRLFVGPMEMEAPPWESVYLGKEGMLFQESTLQVRAFYRAFGLRTLEYRRVPDDSLALELGFLAELAKRSVDALGRGEAEELESLLKGSRDFLAEHLLQWSPRLLDRVEKTDSRIYIELMRLLNAFLARDRETVEELLRKGVYANA